MIDEVSCYDKDDWDKMMTFMIDGMIRMGKALINPLKIIYQKMKKQGIE